MAIRDLPPRYCAFLLRFWEVRSRKPGEPVNWRFSLEDPHSGERRGFPDLDSLFDFLQAQTCEAGEQDA